MAVLRWMIALLLAAFASIPPAAAPPAPPATGVTVTVTRGQGGEWIADYKFDQPSQVWFFPRSGVDAEGQPWRLQVWTVETPRVRLVRAGYYDALASADGPLTRVRIRMKLYTGQPEGKYAPVLRFSDGAVAFYTDQFAIVPSRSVASVRALSVDLNGTFVQPAPVTLVVSAPKQRMLLRGKVSTGRVTIPLGPAGTYIYTGGKSPILNTPAFTGVLDPGLPDWVQAELRTFTPRLMQLYREKLGVPVVGKPMALFAFDRNPPGSAQVGGGVIDGMVVMQIARAEPLENSEDVVNGIRAFIGHEAAHFWVGQTLRIQRPSEGWIMEGAADFLGIRAVEALVPGYDPYWDFHTAMADCLKVVGPMQALSKSEERGAQRAHYSCGSLLLLAADFATRKNNPNADGFTFIRQMMDANRTDSVVNTREWLERFRLATGDTALTAEVRTYITTGVPNPEAFWRRLLKATGAPFPMRTMKTIS